MYACKRRDGLVANLTRHSNSTKPHLRPTALSTHSGDWLHAAPNVSIGLRLSDEATRIAEAHRLGCRACESHVCVCCKTVDTRGLHGLACRRSARRQQRHSQMNDMLWKAVERAQISAAKEPEGFLRSDGKHSHRITLIPWAKGKIDGLGRHCS